MMTTAIVQEAQSPSSPSPSAAAQSNTSFAAIPPHVLIVGKKNAVDYIAPALFRLGSYGELVVKAKGSLSIVTAVNVAEMVKRDVEGLAARSVSIGTDELVIDGTTRRVSYIEIHLARPAAAAPKLEAVPAAAAAAIAPEQQLAQTAAKSKRIRKASSTSTTAAARKKSATTTAAAAAPKKKKAPAAEATA